MVSERIITAVIDHQFDSLVSNMATCNSLEISGFGKYMFHKKKAPNMMIHYLNEKQELISKLPTLEGHVKKRAEIRISQIELSIKTLHQKLQSYENQFCEDIRRLEKLPNSSSRDKTANSKSSI